MHFIRSINILKAYKKQIILLKKKFENFYTGTNLVLRLPLFNIRLNVNF